jgi:RND family efflux transporter MFP subunit
MKKTSPGMIAGILIVILLVAASLGIGIHTGIRTRVEATGSLTKDTQQSSTPLVSVEHPKSIAPSQELVLPGSAQAFVSAPIYARTNGYIKKWYVDIGEHVKTGQLLAEIDSPEIDQQLAQAKADLATAEANLRLARTTADRYQNLLKSDSVAKQDVDEKIGDRDAKQAVADSAGANVKRLLDTQAFEKVIAPFDGVITARKTDIGNLIDSGANSPGKELFDLSATDKLRVFVNVPEIDSQAARPGVQVDLTLDEYPGRRFRGTVARTADSIDPASRTLLTEVDYENAHGELLPGAYVQAHLKLPSGGTTVTIPVSALLFRAEGLRVGVVRASLAELIPVTLGRDFGTSVEVVAGLHPGDWVIANPADSLTTGTPVKMVESKVEAK